MLLRAGADRYVRDGSAREVSRVLTPLWRQTLIIVARDCAADLVFFAGPGRLVEKLFTTIDAFHSPRRRLQLIILTEYGQI